MNKILLYGANGYTAKLIIELLQKQHTNFTIAGRNQTKIEKIAHENKLNFTIFDCENVNKITEILKDYTVLLNAAGPFTKTAQPMIEACLASQTHYLDITGEIEVFEMAQSYHEQAKEKKVMIMPGVGFDVVPSDCLANFLKEQLPDATHLSLAFTSVGGGISHGTATTMAENMGSGTLIRENHTIVQQAMGKLNKWVDFGKKKVFCTSIPWGDVSTAYYSTKIPNIIVYTKAPFREKTPRFVIQSTLGIAKLDFVKKLVKRYIDKNISGPNQKIREKSKSLLWGEVKNSQNERKSALLTCKEGYTEVSTFVGTN